MLCCLFVKGAAIILIIYEPGRDEGNYLFACTEEQAAVSNNNLVVWILRGVSGALW